MNGLPHTLRRLARRALGRVLLLQTHLAQHGWRASVRKARQKLAPASPPPRYADWVRRFDTLSAADARAIAAHGRTMQPRPLITLIAVLDGAPPDQTRGTLDSLSAQIYPVWELLLVAGDEAAPAARLAAERAARDPRIRIVRAAPAALRAADLAALAAGDVVCVLSLPGRLAPHALHALARAARDGAATLIYTDDDRLDAAGARCAPRFKPDCDHDLALATDYLWGLTAVRKDALAGAAVALPIGDADFPYAVQLALLEGAGCAGVRHIPRVLYHRYAPAVADARPGAAERRLSLAAAHLGRLGVLADALPHPLRDGCVRIRYRVPQPCPRVSVIIPTRDNIPLLRQCLDGVLNRTRYKDLEVLVLDNDSRSAEAGEFFAALGRDPRVRVVPYPHPFNFSAINNVGAAQAGGEILAFLNNDVDVITPDWLEEMVGHALRPEVGAVGAKLCYGDGAIQHAGVVTGVHGIAGHALKGVSPEDARGLERLSLTRRVSAVTAACMVMRKAVFLDAGGFDAENLAVAYNDVDLCLRLRTLGYAVVWTPFAELYHHESRSRGADTDPDKVFRFLREVTCMYRRWGPVLRDDPFYNPNLTLLSEDLALAVPPRTQRPWA